MHTSSFKPPGVAFRGGPPSVGFSSVSQQQQPAPLPDSVGDGERIPLLSSPSPCSSLGTIVSPLQDACPGRDSVYSGGALSSLASSFSGVSVGGLSGGVGSGVRAREGVVLNCGSTGSGSYSAREGWKARAARVLGPGLLV
eukprot:RCo035490